jgi:hypothetical protein
MVGAIFASKAALGANFPEVGLLLVFACVGSLAYLSSLRVIRPAQFREAISYWSASNLPFPRLPRVGRARAAART